VSGTDIGGFCRELLRSPDYRESLKTRLVNGTLAPAVEVLLHHYAFGRPTETVSISVQRVEEDLSTVSVDELLERASQLQRQLEDAKQLNDALPAEYKVDMSSCREGDAAESSSADPSE
jgi:hypothetical protein